MSKKVALLLLSSILIASCSSFPTSKDRRYKMRYYECNYNRIFPEEAHIEGMVGQKNYECNY